MRSVYLSIHLCHAAGQSRRRIHRDYVTQDIESHLEHVNDCLLFV